MDARWQGELEARVATLEREVTTLRQQQHDEHRKEDAVLTKLDEIAAAMTTQAMTKASAPPTPVSPSSTWITQRDVSLVIATATMTAAIILWLVNVTNAMPK